MTRKDIPNNQPMSDIEFNQAFYDAYYAVVYFIIGKKTIDEAIATLLPIVTSYGYTLTTVDLTATIVPNTVYYDKSKGVFKIIKFKKFRSLIKSGCWYNKLSLSPESKVSELALQDFLVRCSSFKCAHKGHVIKDIEAQLSILDDNHNKCEAHISAGFCEQCKVYFILESTFEALKSKGVPLCRIIDEKTYAKNDSNNAMQLAQESILMQYGYNVSQQDEVTQERRHNILAMLIDNNIMSKSQIISYLDFFIRQRKSQDKYLIAISKWKEDKEFIKKYRAGQYISVGVGTIYRL